MSMGEHVEMERKYDVDVAAQAPTTSEEFEPRLGAGEELVLDAVYFDTEDLALHHRGITLRRRTGGDDEGWHVKIPHGLDEKTETRRPLGRAVRTVPRDLVDLVRAFVRDRSLVPVVRVVNRRVEFPVLEGTDRIGTLCDDHVTATAMAPEVGSQGEQVWREWELELAEGQPHSSFDLVESMVLRAGARRTVRGSKVEQVLGPRGTPATPAPPGSLGALLVDRVREQVDVLLHQDARVRAGSPDGVHRMRVAARRIRSALTTAKRAFEDPPLQVVDELRWLGGALSPARDAHVIHERLRTALVAEPGDLVLGPVRRRLDAELGRGSKDGLVEAEHVLGSERYFRLLDALDAVVEHPALTRRALRRRSRKELGGAVRRDARRLRRAVAAVPHLEGEDRDHALHAVRKKAKRLRYAAELAAPAGGRHAKRLVKRAKAAQKALGGHQDSVIARGRLRELGAKSFLEGENGFTFGLLYGAERAHAERAEHEFWQAWSRVPRPRTAAAWVSNE